MGKNTRQNRETQRLRDVTPGINTLWAELLAPEIPWQEAYPSVEKHVRDLLTEAPAEIYSTNELVEALFPDRFKRGAGITARRRLYKALLALATHGLADCCERGAEKKLKHGRPGHPWIWRAPVEKPWEPTRDDLVWAVTRVEEINGLGDIHADWERFKAIERWCWDSEEQRDAEKLRAEG